MESETVACLVHGILATSDDDGETWSWADTGEPINSHEEADRRPCARCGNPPNEAGEDFCTGHVPGVSSMCCGHGVEKPYLQFSSDATFKMVVSYLKTTKGHSSQYRGVSWYKRDSKWRAQIRYGGGQVHIGLFEKEEDAACAYNTASAWFFGESAQMNLWVWE
jgi:hypothetical protein